jgi:phosphopantetheinyl transferase (holo-ACP synthase)
MPPFALAGLQILALQVPTLADDASAAPWLSRSELVLLANYRFARRRSEFLAGRLAIKGALSEKRGPAIRICCAETLAQGLPTTMRKVDILPDATGRPTVQYESGAVPVEISIAHAAGWAAGASSDQPVGIDIVDLNVTAALPAGLPWLADAPPLWKARLGALLWGFRECLLKAGAVPARHVWELSDVAAVPKQSADELIRCWPAIQCVTALELEVGDRDVAAAFMPLSASAILVIILAAKLPSPTPELFS